MKPSKGELTRTRLIETLTDLAFSKGYGNVSLNDVAQGAGLTHPALYRYFASLEELLIASCLHWVGEARTVIDTSLPVVAGAREQLESMIESNLLYTAEHRKKDALLLTLYSCSIASAEARKVYAELTDGGVRRLHQILAAGVREKEWNLIDPLERAKAVHALLAGTIVQMIIRPDELPIGSRIRRCQTDALRMLRETDAQ